MSSDNVKRDILLEIKDLEIQGFSDEKWHDIIKGVDLTLRRGEVMGLIGDINPNLSWRTETQSCS